ncbi:hypothetical protein B1218_37270, partial [Pseudomonas ogarae]
MATAAPRRPGRSRRFMWKPSSLFSQVLGGEKEKRKKKRKGGRKGEGETSVEGGGKGKGEGEGLGAGLPSRVEIMDDNEQAIGAGTNAKAAAYIEVRVNGERAVQGVGSDENITTASFKALFSG